MLIELTEAGAQDDAGYHRPRGASLQLLEQAGNLMADAFGSTSLMPRARFQEALASADIRNATFELLDRATLARYQALPAVWQGYARRELVRDFKVKNLVDLATNQDALPKVPELSEYPERGLSKSGYTLSVSKRGARFAFSWESFVNDELDELANLPEALSVAARETESREAAALLTDGDGPNAAIFHSTAVNGTSSNLLSGNPPLTSTNLQAAVAAVTARRPADGRPIAASELVLVVPPALEVQARLILSATEIRTQEGTGNNSRILTSTNPLSGMVSRVVVDPWLPVLDSGANAATTWYLVPSPASRRPALALGFLRGHEEPQVRVKAGQGNLVGGGAVAPTDGSFEIDDIQYRVRHVLGSAFMDLLGTAASNGSGS